jgi:hypothetical protein
VLAMNRLRRAYLTIAPGLEPYFTTGHHDDERGLAPPPPRHGAQIPHPAGGALGTRALGSRPGSAVAAGKRLGPEGQSSQVIGTRGSGA